VTRLVAHHNSCTTQMQDIIRVLECTQTIHQIYGDLAMYVGGLYGDWRDNCIVHTDVLYRLNRLIHLKLFRSGCNSLDLWRTHNSCTTQMQDIIRVLECTQTIHQIYGDLAMLEVCMVIGETTAIHTDVLYRLIHLKLSRSGCDSSDLWRTHHSCTYGTQTQDIIRASKCTQTIKRSTLFSVGPSNFQLYPWYANIHKSFGS